MFPIPWNFPLRKKNGNLVNIGDAIDAGTKIPEHDEADAGKVLSVDENGDLEWSDTVNSEIQTLTQNDDAILNVLGAKNLLPNSATTNTINGVTFTVDSDGTIDIDTNGAASTGVAEFQIYGGLSLPIGDYVLSSGNAVPTNIYWSLLTSYGWQDITNGANEKAFSISSGQSISKARIYVESGVTVNHLVIKPMICLASINDGTYVPYAKTNRELTEEQTVTTITGLEWNVAVDSSKEIIAYRIGKIVFVYGYWKSTASIASYSDILTGLPKPKVMAISSDIKNNMASILYNSNNIGAVNNQAATTANVQYFFSFTYLAE